ncbi:nucleoside hydrolase [Aeromonas jandaei]|uniref:nucleoside hydrolase n=1 Tax=Aeromonas jandaei TaxID=650 RepID=UPI0011162F73|nr:nucleoside hydrolase [Aeromonas jandaei]TNI07409.1 hypothetical protein CF104_03820 [Aeromonas jandaei]
MALPVILDCDPGHDDAIALILALASPELKVLAVTTSAGNQTPDKTLNNALRILTLLGRDDIPVAAGAPKPLARELIIADNVHGESGLDGPKLPDPAFAPQAMTGIELMARCLRESPEPVTLVPTGPLDFFMIYHRDPKWGFAGAPLHDPCTIAWLLNPALFHGMECRVDIETRGEHTVGMTVVDRYGLTGKPANALVLLGLDRAGFIDLLVERLRAFG